MSPISKLPFDKTSGWQWTKWLSGWLTFALVGLIGITIFLAVLIGLIEALVP